MTQKLVNFPARRLTPDEHKLVAEWLSLAADIPQAYVSSRASDDPTLCKRIVIVTKPDEGPSHFIHASGGRDNWMVFTVGKRMRLRRFPSLRDALNFVRPVLGLAETEVQHEQADAGNASGHRPSD